MGSPRGWGASGHLGPESLESGAARAGPHQRTRRERPATHPRAELQEQQVGRGLCAQAQTPEQVLMLQRPAEPTRCEPSRVASGGRREGRGYQGTGRG